MFGDRGRPSLTRASSLEKGRQSRARRLAGRSRRINRSRSRSIDRQRLDSICKADFQTGRRKRLGETGDVRSNRALKGLVAGRSPAREPEPVSAVADVVEKTAAFASQTVADLIFVLQRTEMRPGEAFRRRWRDVDRPDDVWLYYPSEWKTGHWRSARRRSQTRPHFGRPIACGPFFKAPAALGSL